MIIYYSLATVKKWSFEVKGIVDNGEEGNIQLIDSAPYLPRSIPQVVVNNHIEISAKSQADGEWQLPLQLGKCRFLYTVQTKSEDVIKTDSLSLIRGEGCFFCLGRAIFLRSFPVDASYQIRIGESGDSSLSGNGMYWEADKGRYLSLSGFLFGDFFKIVVFSVAGISLQLLGEWRMEKSALLLRPLLVKLVQSMVDFFGLPSSRILSFFILQRNGGLLSSEVNMGVGLSFYQGILLLLNQTGTISETDNWLILHEVAHQWLGVGIYAGEADLEWFFEGMASWCAMTLSRDLAYMTEETLHQLLILEGDRYCTAAKTVIGRESGEIDPCHFKQYKIRGGLLLAFGLDLFFIRQGDGNLTDFLRYLYKKCKGEAIYKDDIIEAINKKSGEGIPAFVHDFLEQKRLLPFQEWF